jgi:hypothetical protein
LGFRASFLKRSPTTEARQTFTDLEINMKLPMFLIASATALSLSFGFAPAHAEDAFVSIEQYGADNEFGGSQQGIAID